MGEKYITTNKRTGFGRKGYVTQRKLKMQGFFLPFFHKMSQNTGTCRGWGVTLIGALQRNGFDFT